MRFTYSCRTDKGTVRENNQDSLVVKSAAMGASRVALAAVCDGVGGLSRGEEASRKAAELLSAWFDYELPQIMGESGADRLMPRRLRQLVKEINQEIYCANCRSHISSATTLTAVLLWDYRYLIAHIGDSRVYRIGRQARQMTQDHSWVAQEVAMGRMTREEARKSDRQNVILKCIGAEEEAEPDILEGHIQEETVFLLCTDGFWRLVEEPEWNAFFSPAAAREGNLTEHLYYMTEAVKRRGESDNITAVAIRVF